MENRVIECFVTHVEREGPLLKVWAQLDRKIPTYIEKAILQLADQFENPAYKISDPSSIRIRQLYCAKYSDGSYYRARITSLANIPAGEVAVQFADYGNHEIIPLNNMRKLDPVVGPLASLPDQAADFYLAGVYPATAGEWSMEMLGFIREAICYSDLGFLHTAECVTNAGKKNFIQLMFDNNDFAAMLITKNMGIAILVDTQKTLLVNIMEKKPLPQLTLWPPFNPSEPPPAAQMMVPASLAAAAQMAVAETHQRRIAQQMPSQSQATNQGFVSSAQRRLLNPKAGYVDPGFTPPMQLPQLVEHNYPPSNVQLRLEQARQQQHDAVNQNRIDVAQLQSAQHPYDRSAVNSTRMRLMPPVNQYAGVSQTHAQALSAEQHFANPPVQTSRSTPPVQPSTNNSIDHGGLHNSKDEVRAAHVFQSNMLELNTDHEVFVSFASDGPNGFAIQLSSLEDTLGKLLDEINRDKPSPLTTPLMPGSTCLGRFTLDQTLCRAVVMSVHTDTCHVYYVDFGSSEELPFSDIFELPQRYVIEPQVMAIRFTLSGLGNMTITKQVKEIFCDLVNNKQFLLRVVPPEGPPLRQYGILYDEGRSILDILKEKLKAQQVSYLPIVHPEIGSKEVVAVAYVESPGKFFVQKQDNLVALESVMEELAQHCETAAQLSKSEIFEGLPCCSLYSGDELWYRAQVKNVTEEGVIVDYVDYGNTEPVQLDSLRKISPELVTVMQSQAIPCCLNRLQHAEVSDELMEKFALLTDDKSLTMEVCGRLTDGRLVVELHDMLDSMPVNIGAALRAPKQPLQQKPIEHAKPAPAPAKIISPPVPVAVDERRDSKQSADSYKTYDKPSRNTYNEDKSNKFGESRSNVEDWRKRDDDHEERRGHFDSGRVKDRDTKDLYHPRSSETEERSGNRFGGNANREERGGDRYGGDRDDKRGSRFGDDKDQDERGSNRFGSDRDDKRGSRFGGDKDQDERGNNRFGSDRDDKRGNRYGGDKEVQEERGKNRYGGDRDDRGGNRFGSDTKERYPKERGDGWVSKDQKPDTWGDTRDTQTVVETVQIFATPDQRFSEEIVQPDSSQEAVVIWFISPEHFFVQLKSKRGDIETIMKDIQSAYCGKQANVKDVVVGSPLIARYNADKVLYRAEIVEVKDHSYIVRYVDYGNCEVVKKADMWQIESRFLDLPKQAVLCSLSNVKPIDGDWSKNQEKTDKLFQDSMYQCTFHEHVDAKYLVTLMHSDSSVADELVANGLARTGEPDTVTISEEPIKKEFYDGQTLIGRITYVEGVSNFYAHFNVDEVNRVQALVDEYVQNLENVTPLPVDQIFVDQLCIATADSTQWYRAKIVEPAEAEGVYYVTFFDYGDGDEVPVDKMIPLPEQLSLSVHPAQATEMFLTGSDEIEVEPETEDLFKANLETTDVIIHVDSVSGERLNVTVFSLDGQKLELVKHIGSESTPVEPVVPHPILNQKVSVFVSHVDSPTSVWLQRAKNFDVLTELVDRMYVFYEEGGQGKDLEPKENSLCAAKSVNDDTWYRAKIAAISDEGIQVLFLDYGNSEVVPAENVKALDSTLYIPHALAFNVSLPVVVKTEVESEVLTEMTSEVEYLAVFHRDEERSWYSELFNKKETLSDKLVEQGCVELMENYPFSLFVDELTKLPKLVPGMNVPIYVSHVDSPDRFWIQREDTSVEIEQLQADLQAAVESFEVLADPACGALCAALYLEDGLWYRATVLEVTDSGVSVRFIDYGNTDLVDVSSNPLKVLPTKFAKYDMHAIQCGLNVLPLDTEFSAEATQSFEALVAGTEDALLAKIVAERDCLIIDIFMGDKSFTASLIADDLVLEFAEENSVYISHANSPSEFWIQAERSTKRLETVADSMATAAEFEPLQDITNGNLCAAQFVDDEQWYRARVLAKTEEGTEVEFIDFGNSAVATELRFLPEELAGILPLAKRCSLQHSDGRTEWSDEATEMFVELIAEGTASFSVEILNDDESPAVVQLTHGGKNVGEILLSATSLEEPKNSTEKEEGNLQEVAKDLPETSAEEKEDQFHDTLESLPEQFEDTLQEAITAVEDQFKETADSDLTLESDKTIESTQEEYLDAPESEILIKPITDATDVVSKETSDIIENEESPIEVEAMNNQQESTDLDQESADVEQELADLEQELANVEQESTEVEQESPEVEQESAEVEQESTEVEQESPEVEQESPEVEQESTEVEQESTDVEQQSTDVEVPEKVPQDNVPCVSQFGGDDVPTQDEMESLALQLDDTLNMPLSTEGAIDADFVACEVRKLDIIPQLPDLVRPASPKLEVRDNGDQDGLKSVSRPMTPRNHSEKIVPGSIGRGYSLEELHRVCLEPCRSSPRNIAEKIVPGSISRGVSDEELQKIMFCPINPKFEHSDNLVPDSEGSLERIPEVAHSCPATPIPSSDHPIQRASSVEIGSPYKHKVKHADRIVPGCISSGVSMEEIKATSHEDVEKLKHGERIVPGSISRGISAEEIELSNQEDSDVVPLQNVVNGSGTNSVA